MSALDLIDTHAHLDISPLSNQVEDILLKAKDAGVSQVITMGIDLESSERAVALAEKYHQVFASVGIHPHDAKNASESVFGKLKGLAKGQKVVAWGEIGLDYAKKYSSKNVQKKIFELQLGCARESELPVIIHDRDAHQDVLEILKVYGRGIKGVFHCFSGDIDFLREILNMGLYVSVTGIITFPKAEGLREVISYVPLDSLFLETDCPFLSPVPFRGKANEPARVLHVAEEVAKVKDISIEEVASCTSRNARGFFNLPVP
jgi:TatD DNase family protein